MIYEGLVQFVAIFKLLVVWQGNKLNILFLVIPKLSALKDSTKIW